MLFQIDNGSIGIPYDPYILPYRHTARPSPQTDICIPSQHTSAGLTILNVLSSPQTIVAWNALPKSVVTSPTLDAFKAVLPLRRPIPS